MIKCIKCGAEAEENQNYCTKCGNKIIISKTNDKIEENDIPYMLPSLSLLDQHKVFNQSDKENEIKEYICGIEKTFTFFKIIGKIREVHVGPIYTRYDMELTPNTKISGIKSITDNLMLELGVPDLSIVFPVEKKNYIGIDIRNKEISDVTFREVISSFPKEMADNKSLVALGKNMQGIPIYCAIDKCSCILIGGATGTGKSILIHDIICSLLMRAKPDEIKMILIDTKRIELNIYNGLPHLLTPIINDSKKASIVLQKLVAEAMDRYDKFEGSNTKNIESYNNYIKKKNESLPKESKLPLLPNIIVIIDEIFDMTNSMKDEIEDSLIKISQMARDVGIHLIISTQRPSSDIISSLIKSLMLTRIAFKTVSKRDSSIILDMEGAQNLTSCGDCLFLPFDEKMPMRIKCSYISNEEINRIVSFICQQKSFKLDSLILSSSNNKSTNNYDKLYEEVVEFVVQTKKASASLLQRKFKIGYNRASQLIDELEEKGIVGPPQGSKPREVLVELEDNR